MSDDENHDDHGQSHENDHDHDHRDGNNHHDDHDDHHHDHGGHDNHHAGHGGHDHHHHHDVETVRYAVVTVSSSRSLDEDQAGDAIVSAIEDAGSEVTVRNLIDDDYDGIQSEINTLVSRDDVDAVVTTGGTGVTPDDVTVEATTPLFEKELPGFGELFRRLSYDEVGERVVGTRAVAGVIDTVPVFCLPGSENAARLGAEEIIVRSASHLVGLARRDEDGVDEDETEVT